MSCKITKTIHVMQELKQGVRMDIIGQNYVLVLRGSFSKMFIFNTFFSQNDSHLKMDRKRRLQNLYSYCICNIIIITKNTFIPMERS